MRRAVAIFSLLIALGVAFALQLGARAATLPVSESSRRSAERVWNAQAQGDYPDWQSEEPFFVNNLSLFMTPEEIADVLGEAGRTIDEGFNVYGDNIVVRMRDSLAVNISVSGELGSWKLQRGGVVYATVGDAKNQVIKRLGKPFARYTRPDKPWEIIMNAARQSDIGLFMINDQVHGFMLTEAGLLGFSLLYQGFKTAEL